VHDKRTAHITDSRRELIPLVYRDISSNDPLAASAHRSCLSQIATRDYATRVLEKNSLSIVKEARTASGDLARFPLPRE